MRARAVLIAILVLAVTSVCMRLGFWQLSRLRERQALNAALRQAEQAPPWIVTGEPPPADQVLDRMVQATGEFDERRQFLLAGRERDGVTGVEVVTPLRLAGSATAVLVNRGWLPAIDAATARPQDSPEPGERAVRGLAEPLRRGAGSPRVGLLESDSVTLWSVRSLDPDSIAARLPYAIAGFALRQFPGPGVPDRPRRSPPRRHDEATHVGYAIQWFSFAAITLGGSVAFALSSRRRRRATQAPEVPS